MNKKTTNNDRQLSGNQPDEHRVIPVVHEEMHVHKEVVETGKVHIFKTVREETGHVTVPVTHDEYDIKKVAVNKVMDAPPPAMSYEGETMVIPVVREVIEVVKRFEVIEEIRVTKKAVTINERHEMPLRKEEVKVERRPADNRGTAS